MLATKWAMTMISTLFLVILSLSTTLVSGSLHPADQTTRRPKKGEPMEGRKALIGSDRHQRSVGSPDKILKVLDFSADNDQEPDSNGEYTSATLEAGPLPESFTICSALMVEAWTTDYSSADMFRLLDNDGDRWGNINLFAAYSYTEYEVWFGPVNFIKLVSLKLV